MLDSARDNQRGSGYDRHDSSRDRTDARYDSRTKALPTDDVPYGDKRRRSDADRAPYGDRNRRSESDRAPYGDRQLQHTHYEDSRYRDADRSSRDRLAQQRATVDNDTRRHG